MVDELLLLRQGSSRESGGCLLPSLGTGVTAWRLESNTLLFLGKTSSPIVIKRLRSLRSSGLASPVYTLRLSKGSWLGPCHSCHKRWKEEAVLRGLFHWNRSSGFVLNVSGNLDSCYSPCYQKPPPPWAKPCPLMTPASRLPGKERGLVMWGPGLPPRSRTHLGSPAIWSDLCEGQILLHRLSVWTGCRERPHST